MKKFRTYYLLLITSLILLMLSFLIDEGTFDINVHDTYYVIAYSHIYMMFFLFLFFFFSIYFSLDKAKISFGYLFSKVHIFGTLISALGVLFPYSSVFRPTEFSLFDNSQYVDLSMIISILVFLMLQILFIINIFVILTKQFFKRML